jgi:hypothetical protein
MFFLPKRMKFPNEDRHRVINFRQFESLEDVCSHFTNEKALVSFINKSLLEHDRRKIRDLSARNDDLTIKVYEETGKFMNDDVILTERYGEKSPRKDVTNEG